MQLSFQYHPFHFDFYGGDVNTFALETEKSVYLIDTAVGSALDFIERGLQGALESGKKLYVLNTHYHWDHASLNGFFQWQYGARLLAHPRALDYCDKDAQFQTVYGEFLSLHPQAESIYDLFCDEFAYLAPPDGFFSEGDRFEEEGLSLRVLETPGHSEDSVSFFEENSGFLFVGDAVQGSGFDGNAPFYRDAAAYHSSLLRLAALHPQKILCGHGAVDGRKACEAFLQESLAVYDRIHSAVLAAVNDETQEDKSPCAIASRVAGQLHYPDTVHIYTTVKAHMQIIQP